MSVIVSMNLWMAQPSDLSVNLSSISYQSHEILHIFLGQITIFLWFSYGFPMVFRWKSPCSRPPKCGSAKVHSVGLPGAPKPRGLKGLKGRPRRELRLGAPVYGWRLAKNGGFSHETWWFSIVFCMFMVEDWIGITVGLFNVAMENHHFG